MSNEAVSISTSKYITTIKAVIDGHTYTVRKIGAGEQLDLSREFSKLQELQLEATNLHAKYEVAKTKEDKNKLEIEYINVAKPLADIMERIEDIYINLFDDGEDGKYSRQLVHSLSIGDVRKIYDEIMGALDEKSA